MFHERKSNVLEPRNPAPSNGFSKKTLVSVALLIFTILMPVATALQTHPVSTYLQAGKYSSIANQGGGVNKNSGLMLLAEPAVVSIEAGDKAEYTILVSNTKSNEGIVYLTLGGLPENTIGIFTPNMGIPNFVSRLTIVTEDVKPGSYELTINAMNRKQSQTASVALTIKGAETTSTETTTSTGSTQTTTSTETTTSTSTTTTEDHNLRITFSTDKLSYETGEPVAIEGVVTDSSQNSMNGASVSIQVENPLGSTTHIFQTSTDVQGFFNDTFTLPDNAADGTYITSISAVYQGDSGLAHSTFVVGQSTTPAVSILSLNITANNGVPTTTFKQGQEVLLSVQVTNQGADLEKGMVWLEIDNPLDVPVYITLLSTGFSHDKAVTVEFHFFLAENAVVGVYSANAYVSNGYISQGGVFFDKEQGQFIVETTSTNTTTTTTTTIESTTTNQTTSTTTETTETITTTITNTTVTTTTNTTTTSETITQTTSATTNTTQTNETTTTTSTSNQTSLTETGTTSGSSLASGPIMREKEFTWRSDLQ
jgi:hypothetical protein